MSIDAKNKVVLITGASRGIGKALAQKFLNEGFVVFGTTQERSAESLHENIHQFSLDLNSTESIARCAEELQSRGRRIDVLINNAGVLLDEDEIVVVPEKLRKTLEVNVIGTIDFTERIIPLLGERAHIINISSTAGSISETGNGFSHDPGHYPSYKISKAALNMYTRTLALRLKSEGITVSSVHPGWVKTDMGGLDAPRSPEEAADQVYIFTLSNPESGRFWFDGKELPW